ncbi:MAG: chemotaxis protein CheW [Rhizobacter sp.]|nr:chemotaxis protein CheW [Bacteriovorax sp.]
MKKTTTEIYTSFHIDKTEVAIEVQAVQEVVNFPERIIPMPMAPEFLMGVFNLRGTIIPIINLKNLLHYPECSVNANQKVAIIEIESAKVGLVFDSTSEILRVTEDKISIFGYVAEHSHKVIKGAIKLDEGSRILQILDTTALISIENIPQIIDQQKITANQKKDSRHDQRHKCISFRVKDVRMAIEIAQIYEIVKVPEIKQSSIQNDIFLGIINLRGRTIPVVSFSRVLKMKEIEDFGDIEDQRIIILKINTELIGLMVDSVECINSYYSDDIMAVPLLTKDRVAMFKGCINLPGEGEIFLLSQEHILSHHEILEVTEGHSKIYQNAVENQVLKARTIESYISFRLDHLFGISIKDVKEIINYTDDILSAPGMPHYVKGMLNLRSQLITIIDTRCLYKMKENESETNESKVLIFEKEGERFGLVVDSLESILSIDQDKKFKVPTLLTQNVQNQFQDDIKEIVSVKLDEKEGALIILNIGSVTERIKSLKSA